MISAMTLRPFQRRFIKGAFAAGALLTSQIVSAVSFCARSTGAALADLPRPAIVAAVRSQYDGNRELGPRAAVYGWLAPFRSYKSD